MTLIPFLNRHPDETAWLFGKGPSLSFFDFKTAGPLRAAINDAIAFIPDCRYGFANDGVRRFAGIYQQGQTLFQPERCRWEYSGRGVGADCEVVFFPDDYDDLRIVQQRETLACGLAIRRNTIGSAIQILHIMGVSTVHLVGFDGGHQYASGFEWHTQPIERGDREYDAARSEAIDAAYLMGVTVKINNQPMTPAGKSFVRITRNTFAEQIPYAVGQVVSLDPKVARDLVLAGAAQPFSPPIETAESRQSATAETATIKTRKGK